VFRDVTAQRKAQQAAERLAAIVEYSGDAMFTKDLGSIVRTWNASAERLFGYHAQEIVGKPVTVLVPPDRLAEEDHIMGRLRQGRQVERFETIRVRKDGRSIPVAVSASPLRNGDGEIIGASKVIQDITDLVTAREALVREKELLATTLASIGDAVIVTDPEGRITFLNAEAERLTEWSNAEAAGQPLPKIFRIINEQTRAAVENPVEKVLRLSTVVGLANHTVLITKDGTEIPIDDSAAPIRMPGGTLFGVVMVFRDVTEQRKANAALSESQQRLFGLVNSAMDAVIAVDEAQRIVLFNPASQKMFGVAEAEAVGGLLDRFIPARFRESHRGYVGKFGQTGVTTRQMGALGALSGLRANGEEFPIEASISQMEVGGRRLFTVILRDITERKKAEQAQAKFVAMVNSGFDAIVVRDTKDRITSWNRGAEELYGWTRDEALGQVTHSLFKTQFPKPLDQILADVRRDRHWEGELIHTCKDGRIITVFSRWTEEPGEQGQAQSILETNMDITARKHAEDALREARDNLEKLVQERTAKLHETIGELEAFSYSIVHDMRSPLRSMQGFAQLLIDECAPLTATSGKYVQRIIRAARRMDRLIQDVLSYSQVVRSEFPLERIEVGTLFREILESYPQFEPPKAEIHLDGAFPIVWGNEAALTQCISNLLGNAVKFVDPGVTPKVRVWSEAHSKEVRLFFKDNGIGIEKHAHEKIFQMFQRLTKSYEGTGIGLAIVQKTIRRMGGRVGLESEPGKGSTFWLELKLANEQEALSPGTGPNVQRKVD
jgi:PAS domain S-box-containing protein